MMSTISYAITVCDEYDEFIRLYNLLATYKDYDDEIVVVSDSGYGPTELSLKVNAYCEELQRSGDIVYHTHNLNNDYSEHKNFLFSKCTKDYIFNFDADEYPNHSLIKHINDLITENPSIDLFWIPRINIVHGITESHVKKWNWSISLDTQLPLSKVMSLDSDAYKFLEKTQCVTNKIETMEGDYLISYHAPIVNFPDFQGRLCKNHIGIKWVSSVHEMLVGSKAYTYLPSEHDWSLMHIKDISRQEKQNDKYSQILNLT